MVKDFSTTKRLTDSAESMESPGSIFAEILNGDIENIRTVRATISDQLFEEAVKNYARLDLYMYSAWDPAMRWPFISLLILDF